MMPHIVKKHRLFVVAGIATNHLTRASRRGLVFLAPPGAYF